jgi:hypothetical protein
MIENVEIKWLIIRHNTKTGAQKTFEYKNVDEAFHDWNKISKRRPRGDVQAIFREVTLDSEGHETVTDLGYWKSSLRV